MVPIGKATEIGLRMSDDAPHRSIALSHALHHERPGLWVDDSEQPTSIIWLRGGHEGSWEAFAAGVPEPVLGWLARRAEGRLVALLAPPSWESSVRSMGGRVEIGSIQTWRGFRASSASTSRIEIRQLDLEDSPAFEAVAPSWALRSWGEFETMIGRGIGFVVPTPGGFASLAWTYESDHAHDKIGVATLPRFRRLGLARAVASALLERIVNHRRRLPVWVTNSTNAASVALARSLGFTGSIDESLLRWTPLRS